MTHMLPDHIRDSANSLLSLSVTWLANARQSLGQDGEIALAQTGKALCAAQRHIEELRHIIAAEALRNHHAAMKEATCETH
mgnify:CR=1 FL=1